MVGDKVGSRVNITEIQRLQSKQSGIVGHFNWRKVSPLIEATPEQQLHSMPLLLHQDMGYTKIGCHSRFRCKQSS